MSGLLKFLQILKASLLEDRREKSWKGENLSGPNEGKSIDFQWLARRDSEGKRLDTFDWMTQANWL